MTPCIGKLKASKNTKPSGLENRIIIEEKQGIKGSN
jgi:hypothetical protein